jgi:hypothetical protein
MNIYIIGAIIYVVYTIYSRYKEAQTNRPTMEKPQDGRPQAKQEETFFERLQRIAREMEEQQRKAQAELERQNNPNPNPSTPEYPDEWVVTETGTRVHDRESRPIKEEYQRSRENNEGRDANLKEEYLANRELSRSLESTAVEEYAAASSRGEYRHSKPLVRTPLRKIIPPKSVGRKRKTHPLAKSIFGEGGARRAMIIKTIFDRPEY